MSATPTLLLPLLYPPPLWQPLVCTLCLWVWFYFVPSCAQLCLTPCNPLDYSPPGSSVLGIFQARILELVAISFSRGSSQPRDQTLISYISCIVGRFSTTEQPRKPLDNRAVSNLSRQSDSGVVAHKPWWLFQFFALPVYPTHPSEPSHLHQEGHGPWTEPHWLDSAATTVPQAWFSTEESSTPCFPRHQHAPPSPGRLEEAQNAGLPPTIFFGGQRHTNKENKQAETLNKLTFILSASLWGVSYSTSPLRYFRDIWRKN